MKPRALISIHDVRPATLPDVCATLDVLTGVGIPRVALLVVPGVSWSGDDLTALRDLVAAGHELAAHGWQPEHRPQRPLRRMHASLIARSPAAQRGVSVDGIPALMRRSREWFGEQSLPLPEACVPPGWALGGIRRHAMQELPYATLETLRGVRVRDAAGHYPLTPLPLLTFEADSSVRARVLSDWNRLQLRQARRHGCLPRIALSPASHRLCLGDQMRATLALGWTAISYRSLPGVVLPSHSRASA